MIIIHHTRSVILISVSVQSPAHHYYLHCYTHQSSNPYYTFYVFLFQFLQEGARIQAQLSLSLSSLAKTKAFHTSHPFFLFLFLRQVSSYPTVAFFL
jgi:hypothetical protein